MWSIVTSAGSPPICTNVPVAAPERAADIEHEIVADYEMRQLAAGRGVVVAQDVEPAARVRKDVPAELDGIHDGPRNLPFELRGVSTIAYPACAPLQLNCMMLWRTTTRRAFFSSNRFFTVHVVPRHDGFFVRKLSSTVMSLGTTPAMLLAAPPNMMFSPAASR